MREDTPKNWLHFLKNNGNLQNFYHNKDKMIELQSTVAAFLDDECAKNTRIANYRSGCLILEVTSSVWATKLRLCQIDLLEKLRKEGNCPGMVSIKIVIQPEMQQKTQDLLPGKKNQRRTQKCGPQTAALLQAQASAIGYEPLRTAIEKLSQHVSDKPCGKC